MTTVTEENVKAPVPFENGAYATMDDDTYHGDRFAISSTTLKECRRSAAHLKAKLDGDRGLGESRALVIGRALHCAVLEPHLFDSQYCTAPDPDSLLAYPSSSHADLVAMARDIRDQMVADIRAKHPAAVESSSASLSALCKENKDDLKGYSNWKADEKREKLIALYESRGEKLEFIDDLIAASPAAVFESLSTAKVDELKTMIRSAMPDVIFRDEAAAKIMAGKTEISHGEMKMIEGVVASFKAHPRASKLLVGGTAEVSVFYEHSGTGKQAKVRGDYYREDLAVVADVKSCQDARPEAVMRDIFKYGYHISAAMYLDGFRSANLPAEQFVWLFIEKEAPYACRLYVASPELISLGDAEYNNYMDQYAHGLDSGEWPSYPADIEVIDLPAWANK